MATDVIVFMLDQLSAKWLELAEERHICELPHIRRLRRSGVTFSRAFSSNPLCCPARACLATGLSSRSHGVIEIGYELSEEVPTYMQALRDGGWRTGAFGKVHLSPNFFGTHDDSVYGFDVQHITEDSRDGEWLEWIYHEHPDRFDDVLSTAGLFARMPGSRSFGRDRIDIRDRINAASGGQPFAPDGALPFPEDLSQTNWITQRAIDFIHETPTDIPIHAHISYVQPHSPFTPPARFRKRVTAENIPDPAAPEWRDDSVGQRALEITPGAADEDWRERRAWYFADLIHLDEQLGKVYAALEGSGRLERTLLILVSDHGELLYDHGFRHKEHKHYDACIRVPLVISGPGLAQGAVIDELVQLEDVCPTILELTRTQVPQVPVGGWFAGGAGAIPRFYGRSLVPFLRECGDRPAQWRDWVYVESFNGIGAHDPSYFARTVRTKRYRYTRYPLGNGEQLFDLQSDPDEQRNLVADPHHAAVRAELRDHLLDALVLQDVPKRRHGRVMYGAH
jgi:arylsulfatase A-like enzyme